MPGIGAYVVEGKLGNAIRTWKTELSDSGILRDIKKRNAGYIKPSRKRKAVIDLAKYKEKFRT